MEKIYRYTPLAISKLSTSKSKHCVYGDRALLLSVLSALLSSRHLGSSAASSQSNRKYAHVTKPASPIGRRPSAAFLQNRFLGTLLSPPPPLLRRHLRLFLFSIFPRRSLSFSRSGIAAVAPSSHRLRFPPPRLSSHSTARMSRAKIRTYAMKYISIYTYIGIYAIRGRYRSKKVGVLYLERKKFIYWYC